MQASLSRPPVDLVRPSTRRRFDAAFVRRLASPIALLALWQLGSSSGLIPASKLAAPSTIAATFWSLASSGQLEVNLLVSLGRVAVGFALGVSIGAVLALAAGLSRAGEDLLVVK